MSLSALASAALLWGLIHPPYKPTTAKVYGEGEWVLTVQTDTFTHETRCRLENRHGHHPDVTVVGGALAFRFSPGLDTSDAWFAVDDHPPQPWRDVYAKLVVMGSLSEAERLDNPTGGVVLIPLDALKFAKTATVRPTPRTPPGVFALDRIWTTIASAEAMGCRFTSDLTTQSGARAPFISTEEPAETREER